ncbi:MAG: FAD-dependent oxidoreductase, partial [Bryobacteraceae bacterium]
MTPPFSPSSRHRWDIAVIGAGVFGSWTAWHLGRAGKAVLLLDAWGPAHSRASSGGESRAIRMGYGSDEIYTRMAMHSLTLWRALSERSGQALFHRTGVLWMGREGDARSEATRETLTRAGVEIEFIPCSELVKRYPQMRLTDSSMFGILEPQSGALMARRAVQAVVQDAGRQGVKYSIGAVRPPTGRGRLARVQTTAGETIQAEVFVFACGPWLPKLFPSLLGERIYPTRQEELFFAPPAGDRRF